MQVGEARLEAAAEAAARGRRGSAERLGRRQEREVPVQRAAGPAEVGETEAAEVTVAVVIATGMAVGGRRVGAPLDHPERHSRARKVMATAEASGTGLGSSEEVDVVGKAGRRRRRGGDAECEHCPQRRDSRSQHRALR